MISPKWKFSIALGGILLGACQQKEMLGSDSGPTSPDQCQDCTTPGNPSAFTDEDRRYLDYLVKSGYKLEDIEKKESGYLVEGDIFMPKEHLDARMSLKKTAQRIDNNRVGENVVGGIRVRIAPGINAWASEIQSALGNWNALDSRIHFLLVNDNPHITIFPDTDPSLPSAYRNLSSDVCGIAGFPNMGMPFGIVSINMDNSTLANTPARRIRTITHELGHCIGFHHQNQAGGNLIPGTPNGTDASLMNGGQCSSGALNLSYWDIRAARMIYPAISRNVYSLFKTGTASQMTELHVLDRASNFGGFAGQIATALHQTNSTWKFGLEDFNHDGLVDVFAMADAGASNKFEVHVLNGSNSYQGFLSSVATTQHPVTSNWDRLPGDFNNDGAVDVYMINRSGASGMTEVHVLNGSTNFQSYLLNVATSLGATNQNWTFDLGDYDLDNRLDLFAIRKDGASGKTEVHIFNGAANFQSSLLHTATALHPTDGNWDFKVADYDLDGLLDVYAVNRMGASGKTEVHVISGSNTFQSFLANTASGLGQTTSAWEFQ